PARQGQQVDRVCSTARTRRPPAPHADPVAAAPRCRQRGAPLRGRRTVQSGWRAYRFLLLGWLILTAVDSWESCLVEVTFRPTEAHRRHREFLLGPRRGSLVDPGVARDSVVSIGHRISAVDPEDYLLDPFSSEHLPSSDLRFLAPCDQVPGEGGT